MMRLFAPLRPRVVLDVSVSKVSVLPGDVIVVSWPSSTPFVHSAALRLGHQLREQFPANVVLILMNGITVESVFGDRVNWPDLGLADPWSDAT